MIDSRGEQAIGLEENPQVGEMQAKLLAKIEELTLHLIQAEQENRELRENVQRENRNLKDRLAVLEARGNLITGAKLK